MLPISVCMIMKNEEQNIERCLRSLQSYPFEIILVDTGSTDRSIELARKYVPTIHHFKWVNDFSAARNYSLSLASNDWVMIMDCDTCVDTLNLNSLMNFMKEHPNGLGFLTTQSHYTLNGTDTIYTEQFPRFFNKNLYQYAGKVHEQLIPIDLTTDAPATSASIDVVLEDFSYIGSTEELSQKANRDLQLLLEMLEADKENPYLYFQIGQCYNMIHDDAMAAYYYEQGLNLPVDSSLEYVQMMVIGYGYALLHLEKYEEALGIQILYDDFATTADFVCLMGLIYLRTGHYLEAMAEFIKATTFTDYHVEGSNSYIPYYNMGCINEIFGDMEHALLMYEQCGDFAPALERIHYLTQ